MPHKGSSAGRRPLTPLELAETFHKTPALVAYRVRCGKSSCRCATGEKHGPYWFLRWRDGTRQRRCYVKGNDVTAVLAVLDRRLAEERAGRLARLLALEDLREVEAWLRSIGSPSSPK